MEIENEDELYPIRYLGKLYFADDVDEVFESLYHDKESLLPIGCVYIGENMYVFPDGKIDYI